MALSRSIQSNATEGLLYRIATDVEPAQLRYFANALPATAKEVFIDGRENFRLLPPKASQVTFNLTTQILTEATGAVAEETDSVTITTDAAGVPVVTHTAANPKVAFTAGTAIMTAIDGSRVPVNCTVTSGTAGVTVEVTLFNIVAISKGERRQSFGNSVGIGPLFRERGF